MVIYFGADHRGFALKERLKTFIHGLAYEVFDLGNTSEDPDDDYVTFAAAVGQKISADPVNSRGILVCGSGAGMDIAANRFPAVRSVLGINADQVYAARHEDDANILSLAADFTLPEDAEKIAQIFLLTQFSGEPRHARRIDLLKTIEHGG
jgi:ribose 5-phosphate isomerase B